MQGYSVSFKENVLFSKKTLKLIGGCKFTSLYLCYTKTCLFLVKQLLVKKIKLRHSPRSLILMAHTGIMVIPPALLISTQVRRDSTTIHNMVKVTSTNMETGNIRKVAMEAIINGVDTAEVTVIKKNHWGSTTNYVSFNVCTLNHSVSNGIVIKTIPTYIL